MDNIGKFQVPTSSLRVISIHANRASGKAKGRKVCLNWFLNLPRYLALLHRFQLRVNKPNQI